MWVSHLKVCVFFLLFVFIFCNSYAEHVASMAHFSAHFVSASVEFPVVMMLTVAVSWWECFQPSRQHPRNDFHSNAGADKGVDTSASLSTDTAGVGLAEHDLCDAPSFFDQSQPAVFLHFRFLSDPQFSLAVVFSSTILATDPSTSMHVLNRELSSSFAHSQSFNPLHFTCPLTAVQSVLACAKLHERGWNANVVMKMMEGKD